MNPAKTRRQELYQQFIEEASRSYVDALIHDQIAIAPLVSLYGLINEMRVVSDPRVVDADRAVQPRARRRLCPSNTRRLPVLRCWSGSI